MNEIKHMSTVNYMFIIEGFFSLLSFYYFWQINFTKDAMKNHFWNKNTDKQHK